MNWQKIERFCQNKLTSESFDNEKLICLLQRSFCKDQRRKDGNDLETDTDFQNTPGLHWRAKTYSALSFDRINLFNVANLFSPSRKPIVRCYFFHEPMKTFFFDACQVTIKSRVLHLFPVPPTGRSHIINILLASSFRSVLQIRAWAINGLEKNSVRNLQYGPNYRLIRGVYSDYYYLVCSHGFLGLQTGYFS